MIMILDEILTGKKITMMNSHFAKTNSHDGRKRVGSL